MREKANVLLIFKWARIENEYLQVERQELDHSNLRQFGYKYYKNYIIGLLGILIRT